MDSQFRRSGQRDARRRRLLADEALAGTGHDTPRGGGTAPPLPHYGDAQFLDDLPRLADLAPRGWLWLSIAAVSAMALLAGIVTLHVRLSARASQPALAAFDLANRASLGGVLTAALLVLAAAVAGVIYAIRQHRVDDYRGRYRIWAWAAACTALLGLDRATGLHNALGWSLTELTGTPLWGDGSAWWMVLYGLLLAALGLRMLLDMRECPLATTLLLLAAALVAVNFAVRLDVLGVDSLATPLVFVQTLQMSGALLLVLSLLVYARHVRLDAEGLVPPPAKREKPARRSVAASASSAGDEEDEEEEDEEEDDEDEDEEEEEEEHSAPVVRSGGARTDRPHATPNPLLLGQARPAATSSTAASSAASSGNQKLSKADRKALKERLMQERLKREQAQQSRWR